MASSGSGLTSAQISSIRSELYSLNSKKSRLSSDLQKYDKCISEANKLASDLSGASSLSSQTLSSLRSAFTINNKTPDNGKLEQISEKLTSQASKVRGSLISSLQSEKSKTQSEYNTVSTRISYLNRCLNANRML